MSACGKNRTLVGPAYVHFGANITTSFGEKKLIICKQRRLPTLHGVVLQLFMKCILWTVMRSFSHGLPIDRRLWEGRQPREKEVNHLQTARTRYFAWGCFSTFYEVHPLGDDPIPFHTFWRVDQKKESKS
jgi:hypothetical protein